MALVDEDRTILATSSRLDQLGDVVGKKCCQVFHSTGAVPQDCAILRASGGQSAEEETYDPSTGKWWRIKVIPVVSAGSKRYLYLVEDITKTRGLENGLVQSQQNFRTIFDSTTDAMFVLETDGTVLEVNSAACSIMGQQREALIGRTLTFFGPEGDHPLSVQRDKILAEGSIDLEMPFTDRNGTALQTEIHVQMMYMDGRAVLVATVRDVTAHKATERSVKHNEQRLRALFDQADMAIAMIDLDSRFISVNDRFLRMTGFERSELVGRSVFTLLADVDEEDLQKSLDRLCIGPSDGIVTERRIRRRDGTTGWVRIHTSVIRESPERPNYLVAIVEDIDQGKQAEESLRRSEANYRAIVNDQTELICRFLPDGTLTFANDAYCRYFRARKEELVGHIFFDGIPKDDREMIEDRIWLLSPNEPTTSYEHAYQPLHQPVRWIQWTDRAMFDHEGNVIEYQSVGRDITDRLMAQNALKASEERLRHIVESSKDIVWEADLMGVFTFVSGRVRSSLGYEPEELIGKTPFDFMSYDQSDVALDLVTRIQENGQGVIGQEIEFLHKNGGSVLFEVDIFLVVDSEGQLVSMRGLAKDITERRKSENALRGSAARFRSLVQNSLDIIAVLRPDGTISYISPSSLRLLGYSPEEELVGKNIYTILHPEDVSRVRSSFDRLLQDPLITVAPEFRVRCADGRYAYYEAVGTNLMAEPSVAGLIINARDISERKRSEEVLKRRDEILEAVSLVSERLIRGASWEENINDVIETLGEATLVHRVRLYEMLEGDHGSKNVFLRYEWAAPKVGRAKGVRALDGFDLRKMGLSKWEDTLLIGGIVQSNLGDMHYPGRAVLEDQGVQSVLVVPILAGYELWGYIDLEDMVKEREWTSIEIDALRAATSTLGSAILRERASQDLETEKERLAVTLRSIADGVITTDIHGDVILMNNAAEEMLGYAQAEVEGQPVRRLFRIAKQDRSGEENPVYKVLKSGQRVEMDSHIIINREQSKLTIEDSAAPIRDRSGKVIGAVLVFRDVTARKVMEEELVRSQRLESVGVLAGGIAHDFNNIMTAILGNIALAKTWCRPDARVLDKLLETEKATLRARDLTMQLLTFSKGGAPIRQAASISEILHDTVDFSLSGSNVLPHYSLAPELWAVNIDPGQISQVLDNLIANSKDAMPGGGTLEISACNVELKEGEHASIGPGKYVRLSMSDQGVGIPSENLDKIFEPYFTTKSKGTGLGLAVVYSVISKHEGHIDVESEVGKGTTFHILLPATPEMEVGHSSDRGSIVKGHGRVLLMDDEEFILDVTGEVLRTLGYEVDLARDGEETVELYRKALSEGRRYDAVIMDLTIPGGMGGKEAIRELLKIDPQVKAIVSSGYSSDATMADHRRFGFSGVIPKPYKIEDLSRVMSEIVRGE